MCKRKKGFYLSVLNRMIIFATKFNIDNGLHGFNGHKLKQI